MLAVLTALKGATVGVVEQEVQVLVESVHVPQPGVQAK